MIVSELSVREPMGREPAGCARATEADRHVGSRIREWRLMHGLSQQQLANLIGVTCQQAHKYERGLNRISAGRLFEIAQVVGAPVSWFFEGLHATAKPPEFAQRPRMWLELARNFAAIGDERQQEALSQMARALATTSDAPDERQDEGAAPMAPSFV